jgi:NADPH-dependent 2,4-dienoyl-CoA reductase/sulfur reductase-like enzyme
VALAPGVSGPAAFAAAAEASAGGGVWTDEAQGVSVPAGLPPGAAVRLDRG